MTLRLPNQAIECFEIRFPCLANGTNSTILYRTVMLKYIDNRSKSLHETKFILDKIIRDKLIIFCGVGIQIPALVSPFFIGPHSFMKTK